ncbi:hypothetical protein ANN_11936 [Periplaneta americana]|uniref:Uncharacterized protein n=1 Tax=Periplaneta americana TaxID=6978 RepID=A0ABQ8T871_PERAM|nr:hypothetical protein ANN_11936 [Periplaneta americana]
MSKFGDNAMVQRRAHLSHLYTPFLILQICKQVFRPQNDLDVKLQKYKKLRFIPDCICFGKLSSSKERVKLTKFYVLLKIVISTDCNGRNKTQLTMVLLPQIATEVSDIAICGGVFCTSSLRVEFYAHIAFTHSSRHSPEVIPRTVKKNNQPDSVSCAVLRETQNTIKFDTIADTTVRNAMCHYSSRSTPQVYVILTYLPLRFGERQTQLSRSERARALVERCLCRFFDSRLDDKSFSTE